MTDRLGMVDAEPQHDQMAAISAEYQVIITM